MPQTRVACVHRCVHGKTSRFLRASSPSIPGRPPGFGDWSAGFVVVREPAPRVICAPAGRSGAHLDLAAPIAFCGGERLTPDDRFAASSGPLNDGIQAPPETVSAAAGNRSPADLLVRSL